MAGCVTVTRSLISTVITEKNFSSVKTPLIQQHGEREAASSGYLLKARCCCDIDIRFFLRAIMAPPKQYLGNKTRGGADQFQWDSVKEEKYRENYLGHSVMAPLGRWQRGKDLTWFTKKGQQGHNAKTSGELEIARLKLQEEELMLKVLSGEVIDFGNKLDKFGVNKLTAKTVQAEINLNEKEVEQMPGVGYNSIGIGPSLREQLTQVSHSVLQAKGMGDDGKTPLPSSATSSSLQKKDSSSSGRADEESRRSSSHKIHHRYSCLWPASLPECRQVN
jgi:hypothetical protein